MSIHIQVWSSFFDSSVSPDVRNKNKLFYFWPRHFVAIVWFEDYFIYIFWNYSIISAVSSSNDFFFFLKFKWELLFASQDIFPPSAIIRALGEAPGWFWTPPKPNECEIDVESIKTN